MSNNFLAGDMYFTTRDGGEWCLSRRGIEQYRDVYPLLNVDHELKKAQLWLELNTHRRKTARGMSRFLTAWLNRADADLPKGRNRQSTRDTTLEEDLNDTSWT